MASIIKNQILKHLSKFTKNLSPDKINVSTLKGEGDLSNLELDEVILMELLDLPTWMKLTRATCNRVSVKIQWTKLKSQPICLFLDEVVLEVETCETPRPPNRPAHEASYRSPGKYGFVDRVIDGIYVHINSVSVRFLSKKFHASLQLSRVKVQSVAPNWKPCNDLGPTKIRDTERGEILLFKEVDWQTTRVEAMAVEGETSEPFTSIPLRFIANQSKIRITIKKRLSDCGIIATRLILLLDDLLWVLTDTQLKAAILYVNSLKDLMEKSRQQSKNLAAEKLHIQGQSSGEATSHQEQQQQKQQQNARARSQSHDKIATLFCRYDVPTTTYHVISSRIDLHLCDDSTPESHKHQDHNAQIEGGAMQITLNKLSVDIYPYNRAGGERKHWYRYIDNQGSRNMWVQKLFAAFKTNATKARETCHIASPSQSPAHKPQQKNPTSQNTGSQKTPTNQNIGSQKIPANQNVDSQKNATNPNTGSKQAPPRPPPPTSSQPISSTNTNPSRRPRTSKLLESCYVVKLEDFTIYQVSTADNKRSTPKKFLASDKKQLHLPAEMSVIHVEYTDYFFPDGVDFPVPHANLYILLNPTRLTVDWLTLLWANYFMLSLSQSVAKVDLQLDNAPAEHVDVKLEAIMPRVIVPADEKFENQADRPEGVQLQVSRLMATNTRVEKEYKTEDLAAILDSYSCADLFTSQTFPNDSNKVHAIPNNFSAHAGGIENPYIVKKAKSLVEGKVEGENLDDLQKIWNTNTLKLDARFDMWCIQAEQAWLEFIELNSSKSRPQPFVESVPITLWISVPYEEQMKKEEGRNEKVVKKPVKPIAQKEEMSDTTEVVKKPLKRLYGNQIDAGSEELLKVDDTCVSSTTEVDNSEREKRRARQLLKSYYSEDSDTRDDDKNSSYNGSQAHCDNQESGAIDKATDSRGDVQYVEGQIAQFNVLAKIGPGRVKAQVTHYQYLFLMRLLDSFTKFQIQMNADVEYLSDNPSAALTFSIPLLVQDFELILLIPEEVVHPLEEISSPSVTSGKDDLEAESERFNNVFPLERTSEENSNLVVQEESQSPVEEERDRSASLMELLPSTTPPLSHSQSDSGLCHNTPTLAIEGQPFGKENGFHPTASSQSSRALSEIHMESHALSHSPAGASYNSDSGISSISDAERTRQAIRRPTSKAADHMSKFKSKMSGFADKLKAKMDLGDDNYLDPDDSDRLSIRTDTSDEDFELLSLDEEEGPIFHHHQINQNNRDSETTSISTDTDAVDDLSSYADSSVIAKGKELVSVIAFKLCGIELLLCTDGSETTARVQALQLHTKQLRGITYEEAQRKFISPSGLCSEENSERLVTTHTVKTKFTSRTEIPPTEEAETSLDVMATDCGLQFTTSSLTLLTTFIQDEVPVVSPLPMNIKVEDFCLILEDDHPLQDSAVTPEPLRLEIHKLGITRGLDGVFHLIGEDPKSVEGLDVIKEIKLLKQQNKSLSDRLTSAEIRAEGMDNLEKLNTSLRQENISLQEQLKKFAACDMGSEEDKHSVEALMKDNMKILKRVTALEDEVASLTKERESLLQTLKLLQDELNTSENQRLHSNHS